MVHPRTGLGLLSDPRNFVSIAILRIFSLKINSKAAFCRELAVDLGRTGSSRK